MSGQMSGSPDGTFSERLNRVAQKRGPVEEEKPPVEVLPDWRDNIQGPASYATAFAFGLVAVFLVRLVRFHVFGGSLVGENPDLTMAIDFAAGFALAFGAFKLMPWSGIPFAFAQVAGVIVTLVFMQNVVHSAPILFKLAFSSEWTEETIAMTEPSSMLVRGYSKPLGAKPEEGEEETVVAAVKADAPASAAASEATATEEPALPKVRTQMNGSLIKR